MGGKNRIRMKVHIVHVDEKFVYFHHELDTDRKTWVSALLAEEIWIIRKLDDSDLHEVELLEWIAERKNLT